jgi:hypothetical protein
MPGIKRKFFSGAAVASKCARASLPLAPEILTEDELNDMSKGEIIQHVLELLPHLHLSPNRKHCLQKSWKSSPRKSDRCW